MSPGIPLVAIVSRWGASHVLRVIGCGGKNAHVGLSLTEMDGFFSTVSLSNDAHEIT